MAEKYMSMDSLRFLLYDVHNAEKLFKFSRYQDHDRSTMDIFLDSVKDFSDQELFTTLKEMDEQPAHYKDGKIWVHPALEKIISKSGELGLVANVFDYDHGGMQLPSAFHTASYFILDAANNNISGYPGLTMGSGELIANFGSKELQEAFLPKMLTGEWAGTMCLTEPQAGSSLSDISSTAYPTKEGYHKIKGQKIFISGGDHEYCSNFIHLSLVRIEGAPAGIKGVSLFAIPKFRIDDNGKLVPNDVTTAGDFQKMGQKGYCTTHLAFGENDDCRGWLVGAPNNGLKYMFKMMNGARIAVGRGAVGIVMAAYYASLQYAKERPQGRKLTSTGKKDLSKGQTLIINHPDVRRMLLFQKSVAEGALSLVFQASIYHDLQRVSEGEEKEKYNLLLELLTPVVKTFPSETGRVAVSNGLQILGGYGFCSEFVLQQYYRDIRIYALYEGTTGIQSLDLLGRKITMKNGRALELLAAEMQETIQSANTYDELKPYAAELGNKIALTQKVLGTLLPHAMKGDFERFLADATLFMELFGIICIGWQWLKMGVEAKRALLTGDAHYTSEFYESKILTMRYHFKYEMPKMEALAKTLMDHEVLTIAREKEFIE